MKKISVIVPIYNVENTLEKCVDSIEKNKADLEVILVNDGSKDKSGKIAKKLALQYSNIKYIEKENGGLSDARNCGLKEATGDYISFVDSDDFVDEELYAKLEKYMNEDYDLIKFRINTVSEDGKIIKKHESPVFENKTGEEAFAILFPVDEMLEPSWGYLYNMKFWKENNFEFAKGLYHEDFGLTPFIIVNAKSVVSTNFYGYNYVQTKTSITRGNDKNAYKRANDILVHYDNMLKKLKVYNLSNRTKENIKIYYTNCAILKAKELAGKEQKEYINNLKKRKLYKNIKVRNLKQLIKKIVLMLSINMYLKIR